MYAEGDVSVVLCAYCTRLVMGSRTMGKQNYNHREGNGSSPLHALQAYATWN